MKLVLDKEACNAPKQRALHKILREKKRVYVHAHARAFMCTRVREYMSTHTFTLFNANSYMMFKQHISNIRVGWIQMNIT